MTTLPNLSPALAEAAAGAILTIDLGAVVANWRRLAGELAGVQVGAVVKADAYGLGAAKVVPALVQAGCRWFFVAHLAEALALRACVPDDARLVVLNGLSPGAEGLCAAAGVVPVLNSLGQARRWQALAAQPGAQGQGAPALLQLDTGMSRLGLSAQEAAELARDAGFAAQVQVLAVMSHLACADEPEHPANAAQLARFDSMAGLFPGVPRCLANSGGCLLGAAYHGAIARPGLALYGAEPAQGGHAPFAPVVSLAARVIQMRQVPAGAGAGYGLTWHAAGPTRLATLAVGYADGWLRSLSGRGAAAYGGVLLPLVGRVSMDSTIVDVSGLPDGALAEGDLVELIGPHCPLEQVAQQAGTIAYELLTSLGGRYFRRYRPA